MDKSDWVTLLVAFMSLLAGLAAQRSSAKVAKRTAAAALAAAEITSRSDMETEAYTRARAIDTETIERQAAELTELRERLDKVEDTNDTLVRENRQLRRRVDELERHEREKP